MCARVCVADAVIALCDQSCILLVVVSAQTDVANSFYFLSCVRWRRFPGQLAEKKQIMIQFGPSLLSSTWKQLFFMFFLLFPPISMTSISGGDVGPNLCPSLVYQPERQPCLLWFWLLTPVLSRSATAWFLLVHVSPVFSGISPFINGDGWLLSSVEMTSKTRGKYLMRRR